MAINVPNTYQRQSKRVHSGIVPALFDKIDVTYPTTVKEIYTYSLYNSDNNTYRITAIIEVTYITALKDFVSSVVKTFNDPGYD